MPHYLQLIRLFFSATVPVLSFTTLWICVGRTCMSQKRKMTNWSSRFLHPHPVLYNNYADDVSVIFKNHLHNKTFIDSFNSFTWFKVDGRIHLITGSQFELLATKKQQQSSLNLVMASFLTHQPHHIYVSGQLQNIKFSNCMNFVCTLPQALYSRFQVMVPPK